MVSNEALNQCVTMLVTTEVTLKAQRLNCGDVWCSRRSQFLIYWIRLIRFGSIALRDERFKPDCMESIVKHPGAAYHILVLGDLHLLKKGVKCSEVPLCFGHEFYSIWQRLVSQLQSVL